jgi:hypothetical protein
VLSLNVDMSEILGLLDLDEAAATEGHKAAAALTAATHAKAVEYAGRFLHTRRKMFVDNLTYFQESDDVWIVSLDAKAVWIDEGMDEHNMLNDLLASPKAKTSKTGSKYIVIPFKQNKGKQDQTPAQQALLGTIKKALKDVDATPNKIEMGPGGQPKLGLVRSLDITKAPVSTSSLRIGAGPVNQVAQGATGGIPLLKGIRIYQSEYKKDDGSTGIRRDVMTFRVASSKQQGKWNHPGTEGVHILDKACEWAVQEWGKMSEALLGKIIASVSK